MKRLAHGSLHHTFEEIAALDRLGLLRDQLLHECLKVLDQRTVFELTQTNLALDESVSVDAELHQADLALLHLSDYLVLLDERAGLRVRHQPLRTENSRKLLQINQLFLRAEQLVEVGVAGGDVGENLVVTDNISTRLPQLVVIHLVSENADTDLLASASRQVDRATNHLVALRRVNVQLDDRVDRLTEVARFGLFLDLFDGVNSQVRRLVLDFPHSDLSLYQSQSN